MHRKAEGTWLYYGSALKRSLSKSQTSRAIEFPEFLDKEKFGQGNKSIHHTVGYPSDHT